MANSSMDSLARLREQLTQAHPDQLRTMLQAMAEQLMSAEVDALCGARPRRAQPGAGELPQRVPGAAVGYQGGQHRPRDPQGPPGYYPGWLLEKPGHPGESGLDRQCSRRRPRSTPARLTWWSCVKTIAACARERSRHRDCRTLIGRIPNLNRVAPEHGLEP
jgi:hypothetical protein